MNRIYTLSYVEKELSTKCWVFNLSLRVFADSKALLCLQNAHGEKIGHKGLGWVGYEILG